MQKLIRMGLFWVVPGFALANSFGTNILANATTECGGSSTLGPEQPPLGVGHASVSSGPCVFALVFPMSASASASVDLLGTSSEIEGSALSMGVGSLGGSSATYFDTVTLNSPLIDYTGSVSVGVADAYTLDLSGVSGLAAGQSSVALGILSINGLQAPVSYRASRGVVSDGAYSGQLDVSFSILSCPCSFVFELTGEAEAANGVSADFNDPVVIALPDGWTYSLASHQTGGTVAAVEPGSLFELGLGVIVIGAVGAGFSRNPRVI
jgi:hypothetical protein